MVIGMSNAESLDTFNTGHLKFRVGDPANFGRYDELHAVAVTAFEDALPRSGSDIRHMLGVTREYYRASRQNPQLLADNDAFYSGQSYFGARLVVAENENDAIAGYGYAANNVSGNALERRLKRFSTGHRWAYMREVVTLNEAPSGTGTIIAGLLMDGFKPDQPVSAYTWEEGQKGERFAAHIGLQQARGSATVYPFGRHAHPATMHRWTGIVSQVLQTIESMPGGVEALQHARSTARRLY